MEIFNEFKNGILKRKELKLGINAESNPGFKYALKIVAEKFETGEELVVINNVLSKFGTDKFLIDAFVYDTIEDKNKILHKKDLKNIKGKKKEANK